MFSLLLKARPKLGGSYNYTSAPPLKINPGYYFFFHMVDFFSKSGLCVVIQTGTRCLLVLNVAVIIIWNALETIVMHISAS